MRVTVTILEVLCVIVAVRASGYNDDGYGGNNGYNDGGYSGSGGYGGGRYQNSPAYSSGYAKQEEYPSYDRDYSFNYGVKDDYTYNYQTRDEVKKGNTVYGSYSVVEPDGNLRVVKYEADDYGFRAIVDREGYGAPVSYGHEAPASSYKAAPAPYRQPPQSYDNNDYAPAPVYKAPAPYKAPYKAPQAYKAPGPYRAPQAYKAPAPYKAPSAYKSQGYGGPTSSSYSSVSSYKAPSAPIYGKRPSDYRRPAPYSSNYGAPY